jgi:DNA-binding response OmpR family regulator
MLSSALLTAAHWARNNERAAGKEFARESRAQIEGRDRINGKALMRLLIAEDDKALGLFLSRGLEADGHRVHLAYDGAAAVEAFRQEMPDLTILDLNMPVKDGEQVLDEIRLMDQNLPVLVLTGRQEVETRVRCLDHGADDLMTKPFSLHELRARVRALLRRKRETRLQLRAGDLELDRLEHTAHRAGRLIVLTNKEFALLEHLMLNRGECVSRVDLLDSVWNMEPTQTTNIVDVYVNYLRRKLEDPPPGRVIRTVRGHGYMVPPESELSASETAVAPLDATIAASPAETALIPPAIAR